MKPLSPELLDALQAQITWERQNHDIYKQIRWYLEAGNWPGFAKWFMTRAHSEKGDANRFSEYIITRRGVPIYDAVPAPGVPLADNIFDYFAAGLEREKQTSELILGLAAMAEAEGDAGAEEFLDVMITDQEEDELRFYNACQDLARATGDNAAALKLDHDYGKGKRGR